MNEEIVASPAAQLHLRGDVDPGAPARRLHARLLESAIEVLLGHPAVAPVALHE
jgi:hypothetical protein